MDNIVTLPSKATAMTAAPCFNFDGHKIRVGLDPFGNPLVVIADICAAVGMGDAKDAAARLDADEKGRVSIPTLGGPQEMLGVTEPGVFRLLATSRSERARPFQRWLYHEVLPAIRRDGAYLPPQRNTPADADEKLELAREREQRLKQREQRLAQAEARKTFETIMAALPDLSQRSKQALVATTFNPVLASPVLPAPIVEERFWATTELAAEVGMAPSPFGKAVKHLKTSNNGETRLGKAQGHPRQVEQWFWNAAGRAAVLTMFRGTVN